MKYKVEAVVICVQAIVGYNFGADKTIGSNDTYSLSFETDGTERLKLHSDGRGLSQFTAKAWSKYDQVTNVVRDSHNISSVADNGTGLIRFNFTNNMGNASYSFVATTHYGGGTNDVGIIQWEGDGAALVGSVAVHSLIALNSATTFTLIDAQQLYIQIFGD